jgi:hypothetical protein
VTYRSAVPLPEPPVRYAPILATIWLVAGVVMMLTGRGTSGTTLLPLDFVNIPAAMALEGDAREG